MHLRRRVRAAQRRRSQAVAAAARARGRSDGPAIVPSTRGTATPVGRSPRRRFATLKFGSGVSHRSPVAVRFCLGLADKASTGVGEVVISAQVESVIGTSCWPKRSCRRRHYCRAASSVRNRNGCLVGFAALSAKATDETRPRTNVDVTSCIMAFSLWLYPIRPLYTCRMAGRHACRRMPVARN